jgi:4-amino-4-deoxy-L-arabinose transferase-like glycosyltransferase
MNKIKVFLSSQKSYAIIFWVMILIRGIFNYEIPLTDNTEARYAEIARIMSETKNWITLQIDYGIPFWAKPPLSTWASALSISIFGNHEFFVRLPFLMLAIILVFSLGHHKNKSSRYLPGIILLSLPEFYLHAGVVSTDMFLSFSIALIMLSFWEAIKIKTKSYWGYLFFVGLALGLLSKGPIALFLSLPPILIWSIISNNIKKAFKTAPWLLGTIITMLISLPWYYLVELRSPGFLNYFIVGEHFERFFNSDWRGDKYGFAKQQPFGIIWSFFIIFTLPWFILFIKILIKKWSEIKKDYWALFLLIWMLWTPLFFTFSRSLIHPYILPSMVPLALFINHFWTTAKNKNIYLYFGLSITTALIFFLLTGVAKPLYENNTDKYILKNLDSNLPIYSLEQKSYSSQFYTKGRIELINQEKFENLVTKDSEFYIRISNKRWVSLSLSVRKKLEIINNNRKAGVYQFQN